MERNRLNFPEQADTKKRKEICGTLADSSKAHGSPSIPTSTSQLTSTAENKRVKQDCFTESGSWEKSESPSFRSCDEIVRSLIELEPLPSKKPPSLKMLTKQEKAELEMVFGIGDERPWRDEDDWAGNLAFVDEEIVNPDEKARKKQTFRQSLLQWAANTKNGKRLVYSLIRLVVNMKSTPEEAKRILSFADPSSLQDLERKIRRTSYDPGVLQQDGWSTERTETDKSASGGTHWIGEKVRWQNADATVLAYVYDEDLGDLWKIAWAEGGELTTCDMEVEELQEARKKWLRRHSSFKVSTDSNARKSSRFFSSENFSVSGVEEGIVLASTLSKSARQGVYWPARIVHPNENMGGSPQGKRSISKHKLELVFLCPYWDTEAPLHRSRKVEGLSESGRSSFQSGALFQVESVEAIHETIQAYPFDPNNSIDIDQVRNSFRFTGLPKSAFSRFFDSHRLAMALKLYARKHINRSHSPADMATAGLFETHPMAVRAPLFPNIVLHLPFRFILAQLPPVDSYNNGVSPAECVLDLSVIVDSMKPPMSWGTKQETTMATPDRVTTASCPASLTPSIKLFERESSPEHVLREIVSGLPHLERIFSGYISETTVGGFVRYASDFVSAVEEQLTAVGKTIDHTGYGKLVNQWAMVRSMGEAAFHSLGGNSANSAAKHTQEWRISSERLYRHLIQRLERKKQTLIVTDWRCNLHLTSGAAFERSIRLPAALKGAKLAGLGSSSDIELQKSVSDAYLEYVETKLLVRAHETKYLEKLKTRCDSVQSNNDVVMLTEDSDGQGGEDTRGSRGTWKASVCAVAAAVTAVDNVVFGDFVNVFCATRPPGHHAGRSMHAMKAVSNGFCVLNPAACAALHAVGPISEGGRGLDRVCVIDFDVHHGNGTQDILCSTYDPRFLYISIHAGGSHVNGLPPDEDLNGLLPHANKSGGIYPGRCGDISPHENVLNIPLGQRVTPHAVGSALISRVTPAVERFSPNLIILSAGFDAHKHDPMGLGTLSAEDFGHITEVACQLATKHCSGRLISVLEGGYGVPCCRPQKTVPSVVDPLARNSLDEPAALQEASPECQPVVAEDSKVSYPIPPPPPSYKLFDLGEDLPDDMDDQLPTGMPRRLDKCHAEGFTDCIREHVTALTKCRIRK